MNHNKLQTMEKSITDISIFGEYKQPENRVTAALLHILHLGGQPFVQRLFGDIFDIPSNGINMAPQIKQEKSVPDGLISCDCKYSIFIESKIVCDAINEEQLKNHCTLTNPSENKYLCYITPDASKPQILRTLQVEWLSWNDVVECLLGMIADGLVDAVLSYLIKEFIKLIKHIVYNDRSDINDCSQTPHTINNDRVIIVGGSWGENIALNYNAYICQEGRFFLPAKYIAFYHSHRIKYVFEIEEIIDSVDITTLSSLACTNYFTAIEPHCTSLIRKYMKLKLVHTCDPEIKNDKVDKNGKPCAFVQGQTYTTLKKIKKATLTSQL